MADGSPQVGGVGGAATGPAASPAQTARSGAVGSRREGRAPVSAFVSGQEVLAWHRTNGWQQAVVATVRDDGKYLLNWLDGEETDRVKTRTNLRKGVKDQLKNSAKSSSPRVSLVENLGAEGEATVALAGENTAGGDLSVDGIKVAVGEIVISGGEVFESGAEPGAVGGVASQAGNTDHSAHTGGLKDQDALAAGGVGFMKRDKKKGLDGEGEEEESQADILAGSKGAVPPPLSAGGWQKSEHQGLMSMWFQHKRWYHCEQCDYLNDRLYHSKMHYERIHVKKGKQQFHKRKHTNALDTPTGLKEESRDGENASDNDAGEEAEDGESRDGQRKNKSKIKKAGKEEVTSTSGDGSKSPGKGVKVSGKAMKGVSSTQAGLDVLATLVTAEANAKGEAGSTMSMKAWLEMQVSLAAAKNKLAAEEAAAAKNDSGRDAKRAKTRGSSTADEVARAAEKAGSSKKGAAAVSKKKGEAEGTQVVPGVDPATLDAYQNALSAVAIEEYSKMYQKLLSATSSMDWSKVPPGVVNPLLLASLMANAPPVPDVAKGSGDSKGKGAGDGKKAGAGDRGKGEAAGDGIQPAVSLEGGVAVLLDAMRRHNEEGGKGALKKGKGVKGGKKSAAGDDLASLGALDVASVTALSALIPSWLLGVGASGLVGEGLFAGGLLGNLGVAEVDGDTAKVSAGRKRKARGETSDDEGKDREEEKGEKVNMGAAGAKEGGLGVGADQESEAKEVRCKRPPLSQQEGEDTAATDEVAAASSEGSGGSGGKKSCSASGEIEGGEVEEGSPEKSKDGDSSMQPALTTHSVPVQSEVDSAAEISADPAASALTTMSAIPPPPPPPPPAGLEPPAELEYPVVPAPPAAGTQAVAGAAGVSADANSKPLQASEAKASQPRAASRWPGGLTSEGMVKEPRGKSRREVKNALAEAHKQGLVNIVGDEGSLSRSAELVEAGVLLPMPGGRPDEAILRVDFMFDLATLDGRKKRAQFFKLINSAVGQVGREHSLHNSVVNVIKNMCFMPGSWEPGSPTANWKDASCWKFRSEMLQLHVSKMREEAQNRKRKREHTSEPRMMDNVLSGHSRGELDVTPGQETQGGANLAAVFKEEVRAAVSGLGGGLVGPLASVGIKPEGEAVKVKVPGVEGVTMGIAGAKVVLGEGGAPQVVMGPGGSQVLGGIGVLLEAMAKQGTDDSSAPPPPPPPPEPASMSNMPLMADPAAAAAAVAALSAPDLVATSMPSAAVVAATSAMVMDQLQPVAALSMPIAGSHTFSTSGTPTVLPAVEMQPEDICVAEGGGDIDMGEVAQAEVASSAVTDPDSALTTAPDQSVEDEAVDAGSTLETPDKGYVPSLGDDGASGEKDGGGVLSLEEER